MKHRHSRCSEEDFELIPELRRWNDGAGVSVEDWIMMVGSPEFAIGYMRVFWPKFILHQGGIFLADGFSEEDFESWMVSQSKDIRSVQAVMNHRHPDLLFQGGEDRGMPANQEACIARLLSETWRAKAQLDFPDLDVEVSVEGCDDSGNDVSVSVWVRPTSESGEER